VELRRINVGDYVYLRGNVKSGLHKVVGIRYKWVDLELVPCKYILDIAGDRPSFTTSGIMTKSEYMVMKLKGSENEKPDCSV